MLKFFLINFDINEYNVSLEPIVLFSDHILSDENI